MNIKTVRNIAQSLPEAEDRSNGDMLHFYVRGKHFAWTYLERVDAKRPRQPRPDVLVVRCATEAKDSLLASDPDTFFTTITIGASPRSWFGSTRSAQRICEAC